MFNVLSSLLSEIWRIISSLPIAPHIEFRPSVVLTTPPSFPRKIISLEQTYFVQGHYLNKISVMTGIWRNALWIAQLNTVSLKSMPFLHFLTSFALYLKQLKTFTTCFSFLTQIYFGYLYNKMYMISYDVHYPYGVATQIVI